ncbi:MAG: hypothetical protein JW723_02000 [Bacteroidales bacterium]|nr:hypothetical protein [Bacteroidales bacterium]
MKCWNSLLIIIFLSAFQACQLKSQDLFDVSNSLSYADYLFTAGEYRLAAMEYERMVFMDSTNIKARMMLIRSYRLQGEYQRGLERINSFYRNYSVIPKGIATETGRLLLHERQFEEAGRLLGLNTGFSETDRLFLLTSGEMLKEDYDAANLLLGQNRSVQAEFITDYGNILNLEREFKYKSAGLSVMMSAIIPGTGKIYTGFWKDGIFSFILVAASAYQSYRGFEKNGISSVYGWVFGSFAAGFYIGNLYGSGKSANQYNSEFRHKIQHQVEETFSNYK